MRRRSSVVRAVGGVRRRDLELARELLAPRRSEESILIGINSANLQTLKVVQERFALLAPLLPAGGPASPKAASRRVRCMRDAAAGVSPGADRTALMNRDDPALLLEEILNAARQCRLNGYTPRHVDKNLRHDECRRHCCGGEAGGRCDRFVSLPVRGR